MQPKEETALATILDLFREHVEQQNPLARFPRSMRNRSKYVQPHQGKREQARRLKQSAGTGSGE